MRISPFLRGTAPCSCFLARRKEEQQPAEAVLPKLDASEFLDCVMWLAVSEIKQDGRLPSELAQPREHRTRSDPFEEVHEQLWLNTGPEAKELFARIFGERIPHVCGVFSGSSDKD